MMSTHEASILPSCDALLNRFYENYWNPRWHIELLEKCLEVNKKIYLCLIDCGKAFDLANHNKLMEKTRPSKMDRQD